MSHRALAVSISCALALSAFSIAARAAIVTPVGSSVQAYIGTESDLYQFSNPAAAPWPAVGGPPWTAAAPLPNVPAGTAPFAFTSPPPAYGPNPFPAITFYTDPVGTIAKSTITDTFPVVAGQTSDVQIAIPSWFIIQSAAATGYAYEQVNILADYSINGGVLAASTPNIPLFVTGLFITGGVAQYDAELTYTWQDTIPTLANSANPFPLTGAPVTLGTLNWTFTQAGAGAFGATVTSTGSLLATPSTDGILEITGHMWIAGDPFEMEVSTVPEPGTLGLFAVGALGLLKRKRRACS